MRRVTVLVFCMILSNLFIQAQTILEKQISVDFRNITIEEALEIISKKSGVNYAYNSNKMPVDKKVSFTEYNKTLKQVLDKLFFNTGIEYNLVGNQIVLDLKRKKKITISGFVSDSLTGEKLINATVYEGNTLTGVISNNYGFYSLTLPEGRMNLYASYVGYEKVKKDMLIDHDTVINFYLSPSVLEEVKIVLSQEEDFSKSSSISKMYAPLEKTRTLPVLMGEQDLLKTSQLLPGIQSGTEGTSGLFVRGGTPGQNLILLDGVPVYNVYHMFGFFSVFNNDAIKNVEIYKGGFPARYGGRVSSVLDIRMKEGNTKEIKGSGSIGFISSKLTLEGPIRKDKTSFIISARKSYFNILKGTIRNSIEESFDGYFYYDINVKLNHAFSRKTRLFVSFYSGNDSFRSKNTDAYGDNRAKIQWGNTSTSLRWNYIINEKLFSNVTLVFCNYNFSDDFNNIYSNYSHSGSDYSEIIDLGGKIDLDFLSHLNHRMKFGASCIYHRFNPGETNREIRYEDALNNIDTTYTNKIVYSNEFNSYFEDNICLSRKFCCNIGLHYSLYLAEEKNYHSFQPRFSINYLTSDKWSVKAGYSRMEQFIHLLTNTSTGMPTDLWLPVTKKVKPQQSNQYTIGTIYKINEYFDLNIDFFYKEIFNMIEYKEMIDVDMSWEDNVTSGEGKSYGSELLLQKNKGKLTGWAGYTLSKSDRKFDDIFDGNSFPYKYDKRHDISIVTSYEFNSKVTMGAVWIYSSGYHITVPEAEYKTLNYTDWNRDNNYVYYYESKNNYELPAYHRLDISFNFNKKTKWGERTWSLGIYNVYFKTNPFTVEIEDFNPGKNLKITSVLPFLPFIRYSFKF